MTATIEREEERGRTLESITAPVRERLDALDKFLSSEVDVFEPELRELTEYVLKNSGKRLRPILVFLSGWGGEKQADPLVRAGAVVELVHLATLVHDDILDDATMRHRALTITERHGADVAVLFGDALFAHALKLASDFDTVQVCRIVSQATRKVCAGEVSQTFQRGNPDLSFEEYRRMIELKTAELFSASCELGALLAGHSVEFQKAAALFGRQLGIAYQVFDDLADLIGDESEIGKTLGTDLESGKFTLPLLLFFRDLDPADRSDFLEELTSDSASLARLLVQLRAEGALAETMEIFRKELAAADEALKPFGELEAAARLRQLSEFVSRMAKDLANAHSLG